MKQLQKHERSFTMKKRNIYQNRSQELLSLFEEAGNSAKVMCVPMDYAKKDHVVMFCNGHGDILRKPFSVKNSPDGVKYLVDQATRSCQRRGIKKNHVFFGGEDANSYVENFVSTLRSKGWVVAAVNAHDAKKQRANLQASTDRLDLMGIATMLLDCRANCCPAQSGIYRNLRTLVRHRRKLVVMSTEVKNRIHGVVDRLFPGFLNEGKTGIVPFTSSSLYLMEDRFSPRQVGARHLRTTVAQAKKKGLQKPEDCIRKLKIHAASVLEPVPEWVGSLQTALHHEVQLHRNLLECITQADRQVAQLLARTPAAMLTTIHGIGITLAAGTGSEIGPPARQSSVRRLSSYAGIVSRVKQTGGPEGEPRHGSVSRRCNHLLKNAVVQSANHLGQHGPPELKEDHRRRGAGGQHADFGMARRFLRIGMNLMRTGQCYLPPELREHPEPEALKTYYLKAWERLHGIWKKAGALEEAFDPRNPLGQWRDCIQTLYEIELPL